MRTLRAFAARIGLVLAFSLGGLATSNGDFSNLGNYTLVQHTPTLTATGNPADFSGIAYRDDIGKLYVISNLIPAIHRFSTTGTFEGTISLSGFTDTEGIVYMGGDTFAVIEEGLKAITRITIGSGVVSGTITKASGVTINANIAGSFLNLGFEDLAYDRTLNKFYVVKEKDSTLDGTVVKGVYQVDNLASGGSAATSQLSSVTAALNPLATDLAGIYFNNLPGGHLYIESHEARNIMQITTSGTVVNSLKIPVPAPLGGSANQLEGITFSADGTHLFLIGEPREYLHYQLLDAASTAAASGADNLNAFASANKRTFLTTDAMTGSYAGLYAKTTANGNVLGTVATIIQGKNASGAGETISMNFRDRADIEKVFTSISPPFTYSLISDIVELDGMLKLAGSTSSLGDRRQTDPFALQLTYNATLLAGEDAMLANAGALYLVWLDTEHNGLAGVQTGPSGDIWKNAALGNFGTGTALTNQQMSWLAFCAANSITDANVGSFLGSWGVDMTNKTVWAVVNHNSQFAAVTLVDTTAPVITFTPGPQTVNTGNSPTAALPDVTTLVTATDNVGVASKTQSPAAGTQKAPGTYDVVVTVSDAAGNSAQVTVQVIVRDNGAPVFTTRPPSRSIKAASEQTSIVIGDLISEVVVEDNIGVVSITQNPTAGTVLEAGDHTVRLTATDAAGNSATCDVVVTVVPGNKIPVAGADFAFSTTAGVLIEVLENDTDADAQPLTISAVTQSADGGVVSIEGNKVRYKPGTAVTTARTFTYTITDGEDSATATVTIYTRPAIGFTYVGHLFDTDGTTIRGLLTCTFWKSDGRFTGKLSVGGKRYTVGRTLGESPTLVSAGATSISAGIPVGISAGPLDGSGDPQLSFSIPGAIVGTKWRGLAEKSPYFKRSTAQNISPALGEYTVVFEDEPGAQQPLVAGGANAKVKSPGRANFSGKFGNGQGLSTGTYLLSGGRALFYAGGAKGTKYQSIAGTLTFAAQADRDISGSVLWTVPSGFDSKVPGGLSREYDVVGSRYASSLGTNSPANAMLDFNASGVATFSFDLPSTGRVVNEVRNIGFNQRFFGPPLSAWFRPASGYYSGTYSDTITPKGKFQGWVLQHAAQNRGNGYVLDTNRIGSTSLTPAP